MDLLGDLGATDQLTSTRAENEILKERVKFLEQKCCVLTVENESLKAEVEIYRSEAAASQSSSASGNSEVSTNINRQSDMENFIKSGDGSYAKSKSVELNNCHGAANILCCSLSNDDSVLATGGADRNLTLGLWENAFGEESEEKIVENSSRVNCDAPVIAIDFSRKGHNTKFVAAGCMDGSVHVIFYQKVGKILNAHEVAKTTIKHKKYVRTLAWSQTENILATASADGCVQIHTVVWNLIDSTDIGLERIQTLQLSGPVESLCFREDQLCCYARGSPNLLCFDLQDDFAQQKINLNKGQGNAGFDDHVSFAVMDMSPYENKHLALATDTSRNGIMDWRTGQIVRNLYGHQNDGYSQPKLAWSKNGQYLYGNSQQESVVCVWDIASSSIVDRLESHSNSIRDMYSSNLTETLVTTSFDKKTQFWLSSTD